MTTLWSIPITCAKIRWMFQGPKHYKRLHSGSCRENKEHCISYNTSVTFLTVCTDLISLHVFLYLLTVQQDIVFLQDAVFFPCTCVRFASVLEHFLRNMAHIFLWRISTHSTVPSFSLVSPHTLAIAFLHLSSRATPVHLLVTYTGQWAFRAFVSSASVCQGPDNDQREENKCSQLACIQISTLLVKSFFRFVCTNNEKIYYFHHGYLSTCRHISQRLPLDGFSSNLIVGDLINISVICLQLGPRY
jgi:hypothetical protein